MHEERVLIQQIIRVRERLREREREAEISPYIGHICTWLHTYAFLITYVCVAISQSVQAKISPWIAIPYLALINYLKRVAKLRKFDRLLIVF